MEETRETLPAELLDVEPCNCAAARWLGGRSMYGLGATACVLAIVDAIISPGSFDRGFSGMLGALLLMGWIVANTRTIFGGDRWHRPKFYMALAATLLMAGVGVAVFVRDLLESHG